ncbi:ABC transporter permease [Parenemella sanctibonifatiensis]|uniref:Peptide ABC transporter permease n=1 Tax=Parenemella sanctibonifatiensis TaxID=2016505 RepID=A0A255EG36_9ACTN|nr:ABC transporter permease [Parenemella sanctibonifatiensis]OYN90230.1 peptide ABC transporter permease [Parenemella sanctibonifatiensis]
MAGTRGVGLVARAAWVPVSAVLAGSLTWLAVTLLPGDAAVRILGPNATPERLAELRARLGLDRPVAEQLSDWLVGLLTGDLGTSALTGEPITGLVLSRLADSALLAGIAATIALVVGIGLGTLVGRVRRGRAWAYATLINASAVPDFVIGAVAVGLLALSWRLVPALSLVPPGQTAVSRPEILVIPVLALAIPITIWIARHPAAAVARQADAPHVRAARLLGVSEASVVLRHLLPAALAPLVQLFGWMVAVLVGSTVIVEQLVEYPGIGSLLTEAVGNRDVTVATAIVTVLAAVVAVAVFVCDRLAVRIDPRLAAS